MRASEVDRVARLLMLVAAAMILLILVIAAETFCPVSSPPPAPDEGRSCDLSRVDAEPCPEDQVCVFGRCEAIEETPTCAPAQPCEACSCPAGEVCHAGACRDPASLPAAPLECRFDQDLIRAVARLKVHCSSVNEKVRATVCTPADWKKISLEQRDFDQLLLHFRHRISLHFDRGAPPRSGVSEPVRRHYLAGLKPLAATLRQAKQIFVIGRASPEGDEASNYTMAVRRSDMVAQLLSEVAYPELPPSERPSLPIQQWGMPVRTKDGREVLLELSYFKDRYVSPSLERELGAAPALLWDEASERRFRGLMAQPPDKLSARDLGWLREVINRAVLVVPIPCDGSEVPASAGGGP